MSTHFRLPLVTCIALLAYVDSPFYCQAATITIGAGAGTVTASQTPEHVEDGAIVSLDTSASGSLSLTQTGGVAGAGTATAFGSASADTGVLRASATTHSDNDLGANFTVAGSQVSLTEIFDVSGSGNLTLMMAVDGSVDYDSAFSSPQFGIDYQVQAIASIVYGGNFVNNNLYQNYLTNCSVIVGGACKSYHATISKLLIASAFIENLSEVSILASVLVGLAYGNGSADLSHTATLFYTTDGTLTLSPRDSRFLSNPAFTPSPVPIPGALPMMASALGMLGYTKRKWKNASHAKMRA
jgi:hypothetical protein